MATVMAYTDPLSSDANAQTEFDGRTGDIEKVIKTGQFRKCLPILPSVAATEEV